MLSTQELKLTLQVAGWTHVRVEEDFCWHVFEDEVHRWPPLPDRITQPYAAHPTLYNIYQVKGTGLSAAQDGRSLAMWWLEDHWAMVALNHPYKYEGDGFEAWCQDLALLLQDLRERGQA